MLSRKGPTSAGRSWITQCPGLIPLSKKSHQNVTAVSGKPAASWLIRTQATLRIWRVKRLSIVGARPSTGTGLSGSAVWPETSAPRKAWTPGTGRPIYSSARAFSRWQSHARPCVRNPVFVGQQREDQEP